jgi:protein subunit release factor A
MKKFVQKKMELEIINISKSEAGGFKEVIFSVMEMIFILI